MRRSLPLAKLHDRSAGSCFQLLFSGHRRYRSRFVQAEGLAAQHELIFPNYKAYEALRDGKIDFVAAPAHVALLAFPEWRGAKFLVAFSQGMFWLLVMRADLDVTPGDIAAVKGRTIGAAPLVAGTSSICWPRPASMSHATVRIVGVTGAYEGGRIVRRRRRQGA